MTDCKKMMYYHNIIQVVAGLFLVTIIMADELTPTYEWMDETGDEDGDRLIIDYSEGLNNTTYVIRQLKLSLVIQKGKKHSLQKRIRKLLKTSDLNKAMLLQLLDSLKDGKLQNQEKNKLKRFLHQEES
ncbi:tumor necrosis factor receptor superfamily member 6B isoform X2 [Engystomops pustulosus]|uniref:tumor necrosis factor receptor superfamily member 6B isoform X2 n=1 Tax=Engystomops pustulosus TaxID=76066 RepID=UPI003AFB4C84